MNRIIPYFYNKWPNLTTALSTSFIYLFFYILLIFVILTITSVSFDLNIWEYWKELHDGNKYFQGDYLFSGIAILLLLFFYSHYLAAKKNSREENFEFALKNKYIYPKHILNYYIIRNIAYQNTLKLRLEILKPISPIPIIVLLFGNDLLDKFNWDPVQIILCFAVPTCIYFISLIQTYYLYKKTCHRIATYKQYMITLSLTTNLFQTKNF